MNEEFEKAYTPKEVSLTLDIGTSTLRKWCLALEENGYHFTRTDTQRRLFVEQDIVALKYFQKLVQGENFSLENAAKVIASKYKTEASETRTPSVLPENEIEKRDFKRSNEILEELLERAKKQEQFNQELLRANRELMQRLEDQQKYIDERLNTRDQLLMKSLKESMETRKMIAAAKEEREKEEREKKKGFWSRWFGK
ncbi:MerR family transcriptional regulator [Bacillus smithii]|uniref:MerR family transcriptional regulator n=1 Tax=Bacillus smithii TaxID=1479 RepID=UPI0022E5A139|nr:MerR family transcriptional regulator [Bacillus smithii]